MNISISHVPELSDVNHLVQFYNATIHDLINIHAPLCDKEMRLRPNSAWYSDAIGKAKREKKATGTSVAEICVFTSSAN